MVSVEGDVWGFGVVWFEYDLVVFGGVLFYVVECGFLELGLGG